MRRRHLLWFCAAPILVWGAMAWHGAKLLAHPPRRALQEYHQAILAAPEVHGLKVRRMILSDGTPTLACEPADAPSAKGRRLRAELQGRDISLPSSGAAIGTVVLLHGRRGRKEDWLPAAERFCAVGFRCLMPDLPAHGDHPRDTAAYGQTEAELPAMVVRECSAHLGFEPGRPALIGISMGGAVAIQAAARDPGLWSSLAVISTFDRLEYAVRGQADAVAGRAIGRTWLSGTRAAFRIQAGLPLSQIESLAAARTLRLPVLVAHGTADGVIPLSCGRRLFDAVGSPSKQWVEVPGADHANVLVTDFPLYAALARWALAAAAADT
jgi:pimeloyl-ACP methyl ester carboxylesterase